MLYQTFEYIKFLFQSTNQHGVHSPFVYNLVTKCFYDKTKHEAYRNIINYRKALSKDNTRIKVTDLGVGSRVMNQQERLISNIAKNAGTTVKRAKLLFRLINYFKTKQILELGTSLGIATYAMHLGNQKAHINSIEGCPETSKFAEKQLQAFKAKNISLTTNDFKNAIENLNLNSYNLIFFDGNHQKEATLSYFDILLKTITNDTVFIFDDIYWSKKMTEAWHIIKTHHKVTVTIDTFYWGFVFFRKEQAKEHFKIRV